MKTLKKNFLYNALLKILDGIYPIVTIPYVSRILGADNIGIANFAFNYVAVFSALAALGIPIYGIREIAKVRGSKRASEKVFSELFWINVCSCLIFSLIYIVSISIVPELYRQRSALYIAGIYLYLAPFSIDWYFSGIERYKLISIRSFIVKVITFVLMFVIVREMDDVLQYVFLLVFSVMANNLWNFFQLKHDKFRIRVHFLELKKHILPLFMLYLSSIAMLIYGMLNTIFLGFLSSYEDVGYYSLALKINKMFLIGVTALGLVLIPRISFYQQNHEMSKIKYLLSVSSSFVFFVSIPTVVCMVLVAPVFVRLFLGESFVGTVLPLQILMPLLLIIGFSNIAGLQVLVPFQKDAIFMKILMVGALVNFVINFLLISPFGATGAAISTLTTEIVIALLMCYYVNMKLQLRLFNMLLFCRDFACSLIFIPVFYLFQIFFSGAVLFFSFAVTGGVAYLAIQFFIAKNPVIDFFLHFQEDKL